MPTKIPADSTRSSQTDALSATEIFSLLADDRRRYVLYYLSRHVGGVSLGELAEQIALREDDPTYDRYERILTGLHHSHLPQLVDGGLVRYDVEQETVAGLDAIDDVRPYLDLALADELR